jgi:hypothetical protein
LAHHRRRIVGEADLHEIGALAGSDLAAIREPDGTRGSGNRLNGT